MIDQTKMMTQEEAHDFMGKFIDDVNALVSDRAGPKGYLPAIESVLMQYVLVMVAGYLAAMQRIGRETAVQLGKAPVEVLAVQRKTPDELYEWYTEGFNFGINLGDEKKGETLGKMARFYEAVEQKRAAQPAAEQTSTEEVK